MKIFRNLADKKIAGVCSGVADFLGLNTTFVRIATVLATLFSGGTVIALYALAWVLMPTRSGRINHI